MSTRGWAIISGSNAVVARVTEDGRAVFGDNKPIDLRISGSLVIDLSGSTAPGYLYVDSQGSASLTAGGGGGGTVSASNVVVTPSGNLSSTNVENALYELQNDIDGIPGTVGIIREIQAGSNIGVLNGTFPTASIFLSSSLTNLVSVQTQELTASSIRTAYITSSNIDTDYIDFNGINGEPPWQTGRLYYNTASNFLSSYTEVPGINIHLGHQLIAKVQNDLPITLAKGKIIFITGSSNSDTPRVVTASWESDGSSAKTLAMVMADIAVGARGYAILEGLFEGIDTSGYNPGEMLYLSSSGNITNIVPPSPYHEVRIGQVVRKQSNNGSVFIRIQNGYEIGELHDVVIVAPTDGDLLVYSTSSYDQWINSKTLNGSYTITNALTASSIVATTISASQYIGITAGATPGGIDTSIQFNSGSSLSGSADLIYNYNTSTLSGTTAQFTTITASNITIGEAEDGTYSDGLFTTFTPTTPVGLVVDRFNEVLKGLAPSQAPSLSNIERNTAGGNSMNLSFGNSSPTASYFNVTASLAGLANVDIGGAYSVINGAGGNPIRFGVFTALTALTATLNNNVSANAGAFTNYPAKAFNASPDGVGSYIIEMNDAVLTPTGSTINTASYNANNFSLSLANTASFIGTGLSFDLFRHRTGSVSIPTASWRLGENYFKVTHVSSLGTHVTNYVDWVYDPQAATGNSVYSFTTTSSSFTVSGLKELSGIKYYQTCSFNFTSSIANYYKNVYSQAANGGITFGSLTNGLTATAFVSTPAPANSDVALQRSSAHTLAGVRVLSGTLTSTMSVANGLGKTGASTLTTPTILFDNVNTANTNTIESFCFEDYRVTSASYDTQSSLTTAGNYASGSSLATTELAVYSGSIVYPTRIFNAGNVAGSGIVYMLGGQPNYAGVTQDRFYLRRFVNGASALATFNLVLTGSNINFTAFGGTLTGNAVKIVVKVPGKTGWRDVMTAAPANTTGIALNDNVGCLAGSAPSNITTAAGRSISINLLTEAVGANESYIVRVLASSGWTGTITRIQIA